MVATAPTQEIVPLAPEVPEPPPAPKYEMPKPFMGQMVVYYPKDRRDTRQTDIAHAVRIHNESIEIVRGGIRYTTVLHVSDPRLRLNADQRANGSWDFTDMDRMRDAERQILLDRITALEERLGMTTAPPRSAAQAEPETSALDSPESSGRKSSRK